MKIKKFVIRNFKGIKKATIDISGDVITLIGLNESGKTTILEAISNYISTDTNTRELVNTVFKKASLQEIIPIARKAAFSDSVSIAAQVELEDEDIEKLREVYREKHSMSLDVKNIDRTIMIDRSYKFEDSELKSTMSYWNLNFPMLGKGRGGKKLIGNNIQNDPEERRIWIDGILVLQERHPKIAYFPTFLFDFPEKIYVGFESDSTDNSAMLNSYYSQVIQDVLDSEGSNLNIKKHVLDRIEKFKKGEDMPFAFLSKFSISAEKRQVDAVMQRVSSEMTRVIFGAWNQILGRREAGKRRSCPLQWCNWTALVPCSPA